MSCCNGALSMRHSAEKAHFDFQMVHPAPAIVKRIWQWTRQRAGRRVHLNSDEAELLPLTLGELRDRLTDDDVLEVVGLLMIGKRRLAGEHLVEEEFARPGDVLV